MGPWAEGTHGMVFKAFDVKAHINVALKISKRGFEPELENELSRLETVHSANQGVFTNIIKPLDHFMTRGKLVIVYPFRPVGSLESMVRNRTSQFDFADIQSFARQMINAFLCLSSAGLAHCDLKPMNILLHSSTNGCMSIETLSVDVIAELIDFGVAVESGTTSESGTIGYRGPWCTRDSKSDMYALGITLMDIYTGFKFNRYTFMKSPKGPAEHIKKVLKYFRAPNFTSRQIYVFYQFVLECIVSKDGLIPQKALRLPFLNPALN